MDIIRFKDPLDRKTIIPFVNFADVHIGHISFDRELFEKDLKYYLENNFLVAIGGDTYDMVTRSSKGSMREQNMNKNEAKSYVIESFRPFKERGLIVGMWSGNHCERIFEETDFDIVKDTAEALGVHYFCYEGVVVFSAGVVSYITHIQHGKRGCSVLPGASTNAVYQMMQTVPGCDIYISQHTHYKGAEKLSVYKPLVNGTASIQEQEVTLVKAGSYQARGRYARKCALPPKNLGSVSIFMNVVGDVKNTWRHKNVTTTI